MDEVSVRVLIQAFFCLSVSRSAKHNNFSHGVIQIVIFRTDQTKGNIVHAVCSKKCFSIIQCIIDIKGILSDRQWKPAPLSGF